MGLRLIWALLLVVLLAVLLTAPAAALDTVYLVRHAEKAGWPADRDLDAFQPLSPEGAARAEALAARLKTAGIVHVYTSRTTRTLHTGVPLALATSVPITADDASTKPDEMAAFLTRLREKHEMDKAILVVGHSNTLPELLIRLGAKTECFQRLGITGQPGSLLIESYEGVWTVDLKKPGCEGMGRDAMVVP